MTIQLYTYLKYQLRALRKDDKGATMIEYGLLAALIAVALIVTIGLLSDSLDLVFTKASDELNTAAQ